MDAFYARLVQVERQKNAPMSCPVTPTYCCGVAGCSGDLCAGGVLSWDGGVAGGATGAGEA